MKHNINHDCWDQFVRKFFPSLKGAVIVFGEAGSGKTSFVLSFLKFINQDSIYINTEGSLNYQRALQILGDNPSVKFVDVEDDIKLLRVALEVFKLKKTVAVDSINHLFRLFLFRGLNVSWTIFNTTIALLKQLSGFYPVISTAQVSLAGEEPSGTEALSHYFTLIKIQRSGIEKPGQIYLGDTMIGNYVLAKEGFIWTLCSL